MVSELDFDTCQKQKRARRQASREEVELAHLSAWLNGGPILELSIKMLLLHLKYA